MSVNRKVYVMSFIREVTADGVINVSIGTELYDLI